MQSDHLKVNLFFDFQYKSLTETVNLLVKAAGAFYVTVMIALIGYLITQQVSPSTHRVIVISATLLTACVFAVGIAICWGVTKGIQDMKNTLERYDEDLFCKCNLESFFIRGRKVVLFSIVTCIIVMVLIFTLILINLFW